MKYLYIVELLLRRWTTCRWCRSRTRTSRRRGQINGKSPSNIRWRTRKDTIVPFPMGDLLGSQLSGRSDGTTLQSSIVLSLLHPRTRSPRLGHTRVTVALRTSTRRPRPPHKPLAMGPDDGSLRQCLCGHDDPSKGPQRTHETLNGRRTYR